MVNKFSYVSDGATQISKHFKVKEFVSNIAGKIDSDEILIEDTLVNKLEELITYMNCSKAIITSGYRTVSCDKKVGGTGKGQHVLGKAVDIIFYDSNNKVIDTKLVSCYAQDIGFKGIARISNTATHLDMRDKGTYYGDETKGTNTVTKDFYTYYNISKIDETKVKKVQTKFNLTDETIQYFKNYTYAKDLFEKLSK